MEKRLAIKKIDRQLDAQLRLWKKTLSLPVDHAYRKQACDNYWSLREQKILLLHPGR